MLPLPPRRLVPTLALSLVCLPLLVRAQTPASKPAAVSQMRLQLSFVTGSAADLDNLGVTFDPALTVPTKGQAEPQIIQLRTITSNIASPLYQTVARTRDKLVSVPDMVTPDKTAAKFVEDTQIRYFPPQSNDGLSLHTLDVPLSERKMRRLQTSLSITPRVNADGSVTLVFVPLSGDLNALPKALKVPTAKTVSSGQVVALTGLPFSKENQTDDQELLVFVMPTVLESKAAVNANGSR